MTRRKIYLGPRAKTSKIFAPLKEFLFFSMLPLELRVKIWDMALQTDRVIEFRCQVSTQGLEQYFTDTPPPTLISVSRESRAQALKYYEILEVDAHPDTRPLRAYIDYEHDTVYFAAAHFDSDHQSSEDFAQIRVSQFWGFVGEGPNSTHALDRLQRIAFAGASHEHCSIDSMPLGSYLISFRALRRITLVYGEQCCTERHRKAISLGRTGLREWRQLYGQIHKQNVEALKYWLDETIAEAEYGPESFLDVVNLEIGFGRIYREAECSLLDVTYENRH